MEKKEAKEISNKVPYFDEKGKKEGTFELDKSIFTGNFNSKLIYQAMLMYQANKRVGLASTKVRNVVSGGGKKPWRQKGTGRARAGSIRSPLWRGGGVVFGPHPRNFKYNLPKTIRRRALLDCLNSKVKDGLFNVIKDLAVDEPKTKKFLKLLDNTKISGAVLVAIDKADKNLYLASRNIYYVTLVKYSNLNAYDVLKHNNFLITVQALNNLCKNLKEI